MRLVLRALPAMLLACAGLLPITHASAGWTCTYYKWNATTNSWEQVALLQDEDVYESQPGHARYQSWTCKYCTVPVIVRRPDDLDPALAQVEQAVDGVRGTARDLLGPTAVDPEAVFATVNPFNGPDCPPVPPEWYRL